MIFFLGETPDGWGIPGLHGMLADDELDGYVQGAVYLIGGEKLMRFAKEFRVIVPHLHAGGPTIGALGFPG